DASGYAATRGYPGLAIAAASGGEILSSSNRSSAIVSSPKRNEDLLFSIFRQVCRDYGIGKRAIVDRPRALNNAPPIVLPRLLGTMIMSLAIIGTSSILPAITDPMSTCSSSRLPVDPSRNT